MPASIIKSRSEKPDLTLLGEESFDHSYLGVEMEFEVESEDLQSVARETLDKLGDFAIVKKDDSLVHGFEICSRPATLEVHKEKWTEFFKNVNDRMKVESVLPHEVSGKTETCGMHIHINRKPLSKLQIGKVVAFIHSEKNYEFIKKIAGRDSSDDCSDYKTSLELTDAKIENYRMMSRNMGVNLHNLETIEIRIFKSTTDIETFTRNLEFCDSLIKFTAPSANSIEYTSDFKNFITFVQENKKSYPSLYKFICQL